MCVNFNRAPGRTCGGLIRIAPQRRGEDGPRPGPSLEAVTADLLDTPGLRAPRRPATLKQAARGLKTAHAGIGIHQTQALAHAIVAGWYLHYAGRQVRHGEFGPWLEEHFDGSRQSAEAYRLIGRSYCQDPGNFTGTRSIEEAIKIARSLPKSGGLPEWLPDLLQPPESLEEARRREQREQQARTTHDALRRASARRIAEAAERRRAARARERQLADERTVEEAFHPDTRAGRAARRVEGLISKGKSTEPPEADAFWQKARDLIEAHDLEIIAAVRL